MGANKSKKPKEPANFDLYIKAIRKDKEKYLNVRSSGARDSESSKCSGAINTTVNACIPGNEKNDLYVTFSIALTLLANPT